jgi:hypothetical protein
MIEIVGSLKGLEEGGRRFVVILDGDDAGFKTADGFSRLGLQKNRHFFNLERADFRDKGGKSWDVEIEDLLPLPLVEDFVHLHPEAQEAAYERSGVKKIVIEGKPRDVAGKRQDFKTMLYQFARDHVPAIDTGSLIDLLRRAQKCMGVK